MRLIESGMVRTLIVKDLSRLGREYLEVGKLTELVFPSYGVRFIAINDNVDSFYGENDFVPFKNLFKEFYSAYLYLDIANFYASKGLDGFANWYQVQAKEEQDHAMLFYQYLHNNGQPVILEAVGKPDGAFASLEAPLAAALEHERYVTALINAIYTAAQAAQDYRTVQFLDWFVKEQGEEEKNAADLITKMELFGSDAKGLYMLNSELAARVYTAPSLVL